MAQDITWSEFISLPILLGFDIETKRLAFENPFIYLIVSLFEINWERCCLTREAASYNLVGGLCLVSVSVSTRLCPWVKTRNKQCAFWCLTVCMAHAQLMSIRPGLPVAPFCSLTYSLAHSILPSCSNWHLVQRQTDRGPLRPTPPEMWPSCQPSNTVQPPPEPGRNSRLLPLYLTPRGTANSSALFLTTRSRPVGEHFTIVK